MTRILFLGDFDPCGYALRQCRRMRAFGVDARLAVRDVYWSEGKDADWVLSMSATDTSGLRAFARVADVVVVCPAIGQPWSYSPPYVVGEFLDPDEYGFGDIDFASLNARRVALFHGSKMLQSCAPDYAARYRERGFSIAATTLDYCVSMDAAYLPPVVEVGDLRAPVRQSGERARIIHSPTDQSACNTREFVETVVALGMDRDTTLSQGVPHEELMRLKSQFHVGFDHLRGAFSINAVENAALGLVSLVGLRQDCRERMVRDGWAAPVWPEVTTVDDLRDWLERLRDNYALTRTWQVRGREWYREHFRPEIVAGRNVATLMGAA